MRILLTGNMGYVGPMVVKHLRRERPKAHLVGLDSGFFAHCLTTSGYPESMLDTQRFEDIRDITADDLIGFDAVVHLAAISNDSIGNKFEAITHDINYRTSVKLAQAACAAKVQKFVFASSCGVYGATKDSVPRTEESPLNPLTAYARSKMCTETALSEMDSRGMVITCLRFATACGMSDRLRLDLVVNDFVASAIATGEIRILSDGSPWRPLIDIRDMARAIDWAIGREPECGGEFLAVNVGAKGCNYQICELAEAVAMSIPSTKIAINRYAGPDKRSYRVDFGLYASLAPEHRPRITIEESIETLRDGLLEFGFSDREFRESDFMRLRALEIQIAQGRLGSDLRWSDKFEIPLRKFNRQQTTCRPEGALSDGI